MPVVCRVKTGLARIDAAKALKDAVERAKPILEAIEARWGADVWERHRESKSKDGQ